MSASPINTVDIARRPPVNLAHHFSRASRKRAPNVLKEYYRFLRDPDMGNLAGGKSLQHSFIPMSMTKSIHIGLPYPGNFPFDAIDIRSVAATSLSTPKHVNSTVSGGVNCISILRRSNDEVGIRRVDLDTSLQYGGALGYPPLYAWLKRLATTVYHPNIPYQGGADIIVNGGSADGLSKVYELFFDHWDEGMNDIRDREGLMVEEFVYAPPISQIKPRGVNIVPVKMDNEGMLAHGPGGLKDVLENWDLTQGKRPHVLYIIP
jgi:hypothetical protein